MAQAIIIVNYNNNRDIIECIDAITYLTGNEVLGVFVVENGGPTAYDALVKALTTWGGPCIKTISSKLAHLTCPEGGHRRCVELVTIHGRCPVVVAEAAENLGYGGGANSWLKRLHPYPEWIGFWILNPDTRPEPTALSALKTACSRQRCGMAGSTIVDYQDRDCVGTRGLRWRRWRGNAVHVDHGKHIRDPVAPGGAAAIDSPSGTSIYVTRACIDRIGYLSEEYFLYYEDIEWGMRAKSAGLLARADDSVVPHKYGTTIGSAVSRKDRSRLSVYLETRNNLLFVWRRDPRAIVWLIPRTILRACEFLFVGSVRNAVATFEGMAAFFRGETGRPGFVS
ncbi:MAG TPA: glycosyltransferase family 2 protein [Methylocella sp.]|nr:glycosyltransferase family 2 protein [Methylocella sp.]